MKIQVMSVFGTEHTFNESNMMKQSFDRVNIDYSYGEILNPRDFDTESDFYESVSQAYILNYD